jgi:hypothetical protein
MVLGKRARRRKPDKGVSYDRFQAKQAWAEREKRVLLDLIFSPFTKQMSSLLK